MDFSLADAAMKVGTPTHTLWKLHFQYCINRLVVVSVIKASRRKKEPPSAITTFKNETSTRRIERL